MSLRTSLADGWAGSMIGTRFSDILFGTPTVRETEANLGVLEENKVNIILHGHEPVSYTHLDVYKRQRLYTTIPLYKRQLISCLFFLIRIGCLLYTSNNNFIYIWLQ